jgi:hypothetical protein
METTMKYKTIIHELLQQWPQMHDQLRRDRMLLPAIERYAQELRSNHLIWKERLLALWPGSDPSQIANEALEMALAELEDRLLAESPQDDSLSLGEAISFVRPLTPRE